MSTTYVEDAKLSKKLQQLDIREEGAHHSNSDTKPYTKSVIKTDFNNHIVKKETP